MAPATLSTRPPLQRMMVLHQQLQGGHFPNCRRMGLELEVSAKTIQRDLEFMRDRLGLPIAYDSLRLGFFYREPVVAFPAMEVSAGEVLALCVAQKALAQYEGTSFEKQLTVALRKLTENLQEKITFRWHELEQSISFHKVGRTEADLETFEQISQAVLKSRELTFTYRKIGGTRHEARHLQPYHLGSIENQWYVIGHDLDRGQLRTFALTRMRKVVLTETRFRRPTEFSIERHFRDSFGVYAGGNRRHRIRIRFEPMAGQLVAERSWHDSQKLTALANGEVEMALELCSLHEIERWILSWGPRARVLAPAELVTRVKMAAEEMVARYGAVSGKP